MSKNVKPVEQGSEPPLMLSGEEIAAIKTIQGCLDGALRDVLDASGGSHKALVDSLYPFLANEQILSKILAFACTDKRHVSLKLLCAMRLMYKVDVNALIDGCVAQV